MELNRIHAIQLIGKRPELKCITFILYEMNLVLEDATRLNVIAHGDLEAMREDALALSEFLGKPLWDSLGTVPNLVLRQSR